MRPHAAAGYGVAHHQVVEAGMRDEVEARQQGVGCGQKVVERLYQQRPVGLGQALEIAFAERAVVELPVVPLPWTNRDSTSSRAASCRISPGDRRPVKPGTALRIRSGRLCQTSRRKRVGLKPPSRAVIMDAIIAMRHLQGC
jgi:hypothetical protein